MALPDAAPAPASGPGRGGKRRALVRAGLALAVFIALYAPVRNMAFCFDDRTTLLQNELLHQLTVKDAIVENPFRSVVNLTLMLQLALHRPDLPQNPMLMLAPGPEVTRARHPVYGSDSFFYRALGAKDYIPLTVDQRRGLIFAAPPALPFRLFNLLVHFLNAGLLYLVLVRLAKNREALAALTALAFLLHPLSTEPANYVTARFDLMALGFSLAAIHAHLRADRKPGADLWAALFFVLALLSKETAAPLPLIVFILDLARGRRDFKPLYLLALALLYFILRLQWRIDLGPADATALPWHRYLLLQQRVFWLYLGDLLLPVHLNFEPYVIKQTLIDAVCALINLGLAALSLSVIIKAFLALAPQNSRAVKAPEKKPVKKDRPARAADARPKEARDAKPRAPLPAPPPLPGLWARWSAAALLISALALAPTSSLAPLHDPMREARAYPLIAIAAAALLFGLFPWLLRSTSARFSPAAFRRLATALVCIFLLEEAAGVYSRNQAWRSALALSRDAVAKAPDNPRALYNYGNALKWDQRYGAAIVWFEKAYRLDPRKTDALQNLEILRGILKEQNQAGTKFEGPD